MSEPITDYGKIIAQLASETAPGRRAQLGRMLANRLEHAFGQSVDTAQAVRWETEEWLRQRMGETNDLISQINANQQAVKSELAGGFDALQQALAAFRTHQEAAAADLRRDFHDRLNAVGESLSEFRMEFAAVSDDVAAMKNEMIRYGTRLDHLEAGQAALHGQQEQQARQIRDLAQQITAMRQRDAERPSPEEQAKRIAQLEAHEVRLAGLEKAERLSGEM